MDPFSTPTVHPESALKEFPLIDVNDMTEYCRRVYFATEPFSIATFIIVNACLFFCSRNLDQKRRNEVPITPSEIADMKTMLPRNVDIAVRKLGLLIPHTLDNIKAIMVAVSQSSTPTRYY